MAFNFFDYFEIDVYFVWKCLWFLQLLWVFYWMMCYCWIEEKISIILFLSFPLFASFHPPFCLPQLGFIQIFSIFLHHSLAAMFLQNHHLNWLIKVI